MLIMSGRFNTLKHFRSSDEKASPQNAAVKQEERMYHAEIMY